MKINLATTILLFTAIFSMTSCLNSDENEVVTYDDTSILNVTLGKLTKTDGTTFTGSSYGVNVDNLNDTIYSQTILPVGTDMKKILATFTTKNSGIVTMKNLTDTIHRVIYSTDTLDFTQVRDLYVYSTSGKTKRHYRMSLSVYSERPDTFIWKAAAPVNGDVFATYSSVKTFISGDSIYALAKDATSAKLFAAHKDNADLEWKSNPAIPSLSNTAQAIGCDGKVCVLDTVAKKVYVVSNGNVAAFGSTLHTILAAYDNTVYAINNASELVGYNYDGTKVDVKTKASAAMLPRENISYVVNDLVTDKNSKRITIVGNRSVESDTTAVVWSSVIDKAAGTQEPFVYQKFEDDNKYKLPKFSNLSVTAYDGKLYAVGGKYTQVYESIDHGITWKKSNVLALPSDFETTDNVSVTSDGNYIWMVSKNKVWRGKINK